jgi:hypothetical protein
MSYCSLEEAYGKDFSKQVKNDYYLDTSYSTKMNPSRNNTYLPGERHGSELSRVKNVEDSKNNAVVQSNQDVLEHRRSFNSVSTDPPNRRFEAAPPNPSNIINQERNWKEPAGIHYQGGGDYSQIDELSPKEFLKKSLLKDRPITNSNINYYEPERSDPQGFSTGLTEYKSLNNSPCQDYFYHLDTCKKCQNKLKKRVIRYFKVLQNNNKTPLLPGTLYMKTNQLIDRELFRDENDEVDVYNYEPCQTSDPDRKYIDNGNTKQKEIVENFNGGSSPNTQAIFLMFFGLFIIYTLDNSSKILK